MKNITFAADEDLIEAAREQAAAEGSSLNEQFRHWLSQYAARRRALRALEVLNEVSGQVDLAGPGFTRDELNARS